MKYFALALKIELILLGLFMMYLSFDIVSLSFLTGLGFLTVGIYLAIQGVYGTNFSGCVFFPPIEAPKKKGFFG